MTKCDKHPGYKAIHKPRARCLRCWAQYLEKQDEETGMSSVLTAVVLSALNEFERMENSKGGEKS